MILKKKIPHLVLASTSKYRAEILQRLQIRFTVEKPDADETPLDHESPAATAERLAVLKARSVQRLCGGHQSALTETLIIGSDQVADLNGRQLGKPGTRERAVEQLRLMRGQLVIFHTALALLNANTGRLQSIVVPTTVQLRQYSDDEIIYYLDHEDALDCAGSAKSEGLGAALIARMTSDDPTALIGLPLLALIDMLSAEGVQVLQ